jgi:hypothetical protein
MSAAPMSTSVTAQADPIDFLLERFRANPDAEALVWRDAPTSYGFLAPLSLVLSALFLRRRR